MKPFLSIFFLLVVSQLPNRADSRRRYGSRSKNEESSENGDVSFGGDKPQFSIPDIDFVMESFEPTPTTTETIAHSIVDLINEAKTKKPKDNVDSKDVPAKAICQTQCVGDDDCYKKCVCECGENIKCRKQCLCVKQCKTPKCLLSCFPKKISKLSSVPPYSMPLFPPAEDGNKNNTEVKTVATEVDEESRSVRADKPPVGTVDKESCETGCGADDNCSKKCHCQAKCGEDLECGKRCECGRRCGNNLECKISCAFLRMSMIYSPPSASGGHGQGNPTEGDTSSGLGGEPSILDVIETKSGQTKHTESDQRDSSKTGLGEPSILDVIETKGGQSKHTEGDQRVSSSGTIDGLGQVSVLDVIETKDVVRDDKGKSVCETECAGDEECNKKCDCQAKCAHDIKCGRHCECAKRCGNNLECLLSCSLSNPRQSKVYEQPKLRWFEEDTTSNKN